MTFANAPAEERSAVPRVERVIGERSGTAPGPTLIVVGGVHGNEPAGVVAAERLLRAIDEGGGLRRGRFLALRGNTAALAVEAAEAWTRPRYFDHDLNRLFGEARREDGIEARERDELCAAVADAVRGSHGASVVLDLHTVSSPSPPFIAVEDALPARRFAMRFGLPLVLGIEEELSGLLMDFATRELSCVALTVEAGRHQDKSAARLHECVIRIALVELGMVDPDGVVGDEVSAQGELRAASSGRGRHVYDVRHRAVISDPRFSVLAGMEAFTPVRAGRTVIAEQGGRPVVAQESGLLFMPNRQHTHRVGDDAYFVVRRVGRVWLGLSAWLRSREWLHAALPRVLPGVRRCPRRTGGFLVAPEIASVFRRQIFHLLGYRLVRFTKPPRVNPLRRALGGTWLGVRAIGKMLAGLAHGGERGALPDERDADWVVRRRTLDREAEHAGAYD